MISDIVARRVLSVGALILTLVASAATAETIFGRTVVIDGDTIEIHARRIRILDIDAPESRQLCMKPDGEQWRCGQHAALSLYDWIGERMVVCETTNLDRYKRLLARCAVAGEDIAKWLASNGWAVPYRDCKCEAIRDAAKLWRLGIWSSEFQMPWEWRKAQ